MRWDDAVQGPWNFHREREQLREMHLAPAAVGYAGVDRVDVDSDDLVGA